jgi:hypothetical protein
MNSVVESQAQEHAYELEPDWHLIGESIEPIEPSVIFGDEHIEVGVKDSLGDESKVLILDSTLICSFLSDELYAERTPQILFDLA